MEIDKDKNRLEEICLGHIIRTCPFCKADNKNKYCPNYKPVKMQIYDVKVKDDKYIK